MILSPTEGALVILSIVIAVLLAITLVFSVYALLLRVRNGQRERLTEMLKSRWEGPVLAAIVDPTRVDEVHEVVPEKYRLHFVNFILEYTRRVRGEERQTLRLLASPYLDLIVGRMKHRDAGRRARAVQTLGTLGLLLGTVGVAAVAIQGAIERRGSLAVLHAIGFTRQRLALILWLESLLPVVLGLVIGGGGGLLAATPLLQTARQGIPWDVLATSTASTLLVASLAGLLAVWLLAIPRRPAEE